MNHVGERVEVLELIPGNKRLVSYYSSGGGKNIFTSLCATWITLFDHVAFGPSESASCRPSFAQVPISSPCPN